ncbi:MAG: hypothetical protein KIPDCIKN_01533 [Haliscomenobacter sp.]|jgi:uncharacterized membrane protein (DUF4010 family)|nr:hypothetical protein [Haliscomenobacter sp.]
MEQADQVLILHFVLTAVFSFIIGLELNKKKEKGEAGAVFFGTERTLAFVGIMGFLLLKAGSALPLGYLAGFLVLSALLAIFYFSNILRNERFGLTKILVAQLVYLIPLLLQTQPLWFALLVIVLIIMLIEIKEQIKAFSQRIYSDEFVTLAKFVVITGVILPLAPKEPIVEGIAISFYELWLAVVAISGISYISYLMQKYLFPQAGVILSGILGGLYSSTATTFLLAKRSRTAGGQAAAYAAGILLATVMMLSRVLVFMALFNRPMAWVMMPYFGAIIGGSVLVVYLIYRFGGKEGLQATDHQDMAKQNPLEFRMALIFAGVYIVFSFLTDYTIKTYGSQGLPVLSFIVGLSDIDPFLINLYQSKTEVLPMGVVMLSTWQTITANNLLKMTYALILSGASTRRLLILGFALINAACIGMVFLLRAGAWG